MKSLLKIAILACMPLLGACQFFGPSTNEMTLVAQNQVLNTEIAAIRGTATVEADRLLITLEHSQTSVAQVGGQTSDLSATLIARGTPVVNANALSPQAPLIITTPPPILDLGQGAPAITPISITPGNTTNGNPPPVAIEGGAGGPAIPTPTVATTGSPLTNIVTTDTVGADDCATRTSTTFTAANNQIYVVATAQQLTPQDVVTSRWFMETQEIVFYDWSPSFNINGACIWFYIDRSEIEFTPGNWSVQLSVNGTAIGAPVAFSISG